MSSRRTAPLARVGAPVPSRGSTGLPFVGKPNLEESTVHAIGQPTNLEQRECAECGETVAVRKSDGRLRSHRVGTSYRQSWPCPGAGANTDFR